MRIAITGASGVFGRGIAARLLGQGHEVVGLARHRPESWSREASFVEADVREAAGVRRAVDGTDVVAHCAWVVNSNPDEKLTREINVDGTQNVLDAMRASGARRIVFASSVLAYGSRPAGAAPVTEDDTLAPAPNHLYGYHKAHVESLLANCGHEWVAVRPGIVVGREVDNMVLRLLASPAFPNVNGSAERSLQVVHNDDVHRLFVRAVLGSRTGAVNLAAAGEPTLREITSALGRPMIRVNKRILDASLGALYRRGLVEASPPELDLLLNFPVMDTTRLREEWGYAPAWTANECLDDFALAVRGKVALGKTVVTLPWRVGLVRDVPPVDAEAADGKAPDYAGPQGANGEFDTPVDPRFPTFVATNLSEALPGPFSPSSASVTVRGLRAGGVSIAERLRLRGVVKHEVATRSIGTFAHRLYAGVTSVYFMADAMPGTDPDSMIAQFFGRAIGATSVFGAQRPPTESAAVVRRLIDLVALGATGIGLIAGTARDTDDFVADVDRLEQLTSGDPTELDDGRLLSLISLARDLVVHGWVLAGWSGMFCTATSTALATVSGRDTPPAAGAGLVSSRSMAAVRRLVGAARCDPVVVDLLIHPDARLDTLHKRVPTFHAAVLAELALVGHRGPGECEMRATSYSDHPEQLVRMVAKSLTLGEPALRSPAPTNRAASMPWRARPVAALASRQLRIREIRRDKVVRGIWVLRGLLREHGHRLAQRGVLDTADDVFYLLVDELDAIPVDVMGLVARRRAEQQRLAAVTPPAAFSAAWQPAVTVVPMMAVGDALHGLGVGGTTVRGRVRIVEPDTIDDLQAGEILVAEVTDVGYTPAFNYAAAVITDLGGPMSHAAVVAREFGVTCVVDAAGASRRLPPGALVEVDGKTGVVRILELADEAAATVTVPTQP